MLSKLLHNHMLIITVVFYVIGTHIAALNMNYPVKCMKEAAEMNKFFSKTYSGKE